jgi:hypothetical protein
MLIKLQDQYGTISYWKHLGKNIKKPYYLNGVKVYNFPDTLEIWRI